MRQASAGSQCGDFTVYMVHIASLSHLFMSGFLSDLCRLLSVQSSRCYVHNTVLNHSHYRRRSFRIELNLSTSYLHNVVSLYVLAQTEWKLKDQSIRRQFPTILRERICLFCPSQHSFPHSVIKPNNTSLCCLPSKDRGSSESGDGKCFVNKVVYSESDTEATKTLSRLLFRECCCAARLALIWCRQCCRNNLAKIKWRLHCN